MPRKKASDALKAPEKEDVLSLEEAAQILGVSRSTVYRWQNEGRIRGFKVGRQWRYRRSDLDKFSQMTHPSAAAVKVDELEQVSAALRSQPEDAGDVTFDPALQRYPSTEEEKAVEDLFRALLSTAAQAGASDIHIDGERESTMVRQRIDGVLHEVTKLPRSSHEALVACIKAHAGIPLEQRVLPQDGRFAARIDEQEYDVRAATIPAVYGESVVMRPLIQSLALVQLDQIGMYAEDLDRYIRALIRPCGMVIVTGPTGSGKTTTLYAGLQQVARPEVKTMTVEDPVEYTFRHMTQTPVSKRAGLTFEAAQRAILRHDPDIVMVGEIRTLESAEIAVQTAMTGHLALTQLHATTAAGAITRSLDMGLEPFMVAQTAVFVCSQRLARRICPQCAQPDEADFDVLSPLAERARLGGYQLPGDPQFKRGAGCDNCRQTGYRGRTGIYETMEVNREIQRLILGRASTEEFQQAAVRGGMTTLAADGLRKAADGITSLAEVARVVPQESG
jgi:type IV pilus assembly protein PilB